MPFIDVESEYAKARLAEFSRKYCELYGHAPLAYVHSFGCQQNVSDGEKLKGQLQGVGYEFTSERSQAQLIVLNTCAVRENAEDRVFGTLGEMKRLKELSPDIVIAVCGCMAQQKHIAEKIKAVYKQVDLVFGTFAYNEFYQMLWEVVSQKKRVFNCTQGRLEISEDFRQIRDDKLRAFVPIMYGCNNYCTYCIVPYVRGAERSREPEAVINEVKQLVKDGYKEITLLGQNVNSYGYGFAKLLKKLDLIEGKFRIRFMSSHPKDAGIELIDTIIESEKICKCLHLPVQAGCDRILRLMNRNYTKAQYLDIINYARSRSPDFSFSTDIIVGFPGETYEEFCQTKQLIREVRYDNIYSFVYSPRRGTKAAELEDNISEKQKGLWLRELLLEQREITQQHLKRFVGRTVEVLVEGEGRTGSEYLTGKNDEGIIVELKGDKKHIGEFVQVRVDKAMNWALSGELVEEQ